MLVGACRFAAALSLFLVSTAGFAQIPPSEQPGRERERFVEPPAVRAQPVGAAIALPSTEAPPGAEMVRLFVRRVEIVGSTVYRPEDFAPLYAELIGKQTSLAAVYDLARRVTAKYGADGYVLSRAIVPPQKLNPSGAVVRIQVVEGYVDKVEWPAGIAKYRDFFSDYAAKIVADRPANIRTIERYLLLAGDLPGLKFKSSLKASATNPAAATLVVEMVEKPFDLSARIDNRGSQARGPYQYLGTATLNNIAGAHEAFTANYAGAFQTRELQYVGAGYRQVLTSEGLTVFVNGSFSWSHPGTATLEALNYLTRSGLVEVGLSYPVIRSRERNLTVTGLLFASEDQSDILHAPNSRDRMRGMRLRVDADAADALRGVNALGITFSQGFEGLGSTENDNPLASRADGRVDFSKIEATFSRLQPLFAPVSAFLAAYGQYAFTPLLSSELCGYGGRFFGRAFDPSHITGDHCWLALGELRVDVPGAVTWAAPLQLYGFADYGRVYNESPAFGTPGSSHGASAGGGIRFGWQNAVVADLQASKQIDGARDDWRFFFVVTSKR